MIEWRLVYRGDFKFLNRKLKSPTPNKPIIIPQFFGTDTLTIDVESANRKPTWQTPGKIEQVLVNVPNMSRGAVIPLVFGQQTLNFSIELGQYRLRVVPVDWVDNLKISILAPYEV